MISRDAPTLVGQPAPRFALPALRGGTIDLDAYRGQWNVIVWFSRGFTCPFCRSYIDGILQGYVELRAADTEVIQIAPNLLSSARQFFAASPLPYPFVCDPDKRLYAVYGLGDRGALEATRTAVVSFAHAFTHGDTSRQIRGAWVDVINQNFVRRLHHHATSALDQGLFLIDKAGVIRRRDIIGPIDPIPRAPVLAALVKAHCETAIDR